MNATTEDILTRKYELLCIFSGELIEKDFERELGEVKKMLTDAGARVFHEELWGRRDLAYPIKRQSRGYYAHFDFEASPAALAEFRAAVRLMPSILRSLIVILPENYDPEGFKKPILFGKRDEMREAKRKEAAATVPAEAAPVEKAKVAGVEDEERLKKVEKKLEQILENPDIDIR